MFLQQPNLGFNNPPGGGFNPPGGGGFNIGGNMMAPAYSPQRLPSAMTRPMEFKHNVYAEHPMNDNNHMPNDYSTPQIPPQDSGYGSGMFGSPFQFQFFAPPSATPVYEETPTRPQLTNPKPHDIPVAPPVVYQDVPTRLNLNQFSAPNPKQTVDVPTAPQQEMRSYDPYGIFGGGGDTAASAPPPPPPVADPEPDANTTQLVLKRPSQLKNDGPVPDARAITRDAALANFEPRNYNAMESMMGNDDFGNPGTRLQSMPMGHPQALKPYLYEGGKQLGEQEESEEAERNKDDPTRIPTFVKVRGLPSNQDPRVVNKKTRKKKKANNFYDGWFPFSICK